MPQLSYGYLDDLLSKVANLRSLAIATDYISNNFFLTAGKFSPSHPLEALELDESGAADLRVDDRVTANRIFFAVADGGLGNLRRVRISKNLGWQDSHEDREDVEDLNELLEARAREAGVVDPEHKAGVWISD